MEAMGLWSYGLLQASGLKGEPDGVRYNGACCGAVDRRDDL
jgi:hypothetical protein